MDGRVLLFLCAAILGAVFFLGSAEKEVSAAPPKQVETRDRVVDLRHQEIRRTLVQEGYDLEDPASFVRERDGRIVVGGPVAASEHMTPAFVRDVTVGYHRPKISGKPAKVSRTVFFSRFKRCGVVRCGCCSTTIVRCGAVGCSAVWGLLTIYTVRSGRDFVFHLLRRGAVQTTPHHTAP